VELRFTRSGQNGLHYSAMDIGEPKIAATETVGELFVIHPQQV
jgi:hypothetical protein